MRQQQPNRRKTKMLYYTLATLTSFYSVIAVALLVVNFYMKRTYGIDGTTERINRLAGTKKIRAFQIFSYVSMVAWIALALPWIDLTTFGWFSHFENRGLRTYFGWMEHNEASTYFFVMFFNILGAKAALVLAELSGLLRKGRVVMVPRGIIHIWMHELR